MAASWGSVTVRPFTTSCGGPSPRLGWGVLHFLQWGFSFPHAPSGRPLLPPPGPRTASPRSAPLALSRGGGPRPQKVKCPVLDRVGLFCGYQAGWKGAVPTQSLARLPLLDTWVLLITPSRCLRFLTRAHLKGLLQGGGGRLDGEEASQPLAPPREVSRLRDLCWGGGGGGNEGMPWPPPAIPHLLSPPRGQWALSCQVITIPRALPTWACSLPRKSWGRPCRNVRVRNTPSHRALSPEAWLGFGGLAGPPPSEQVSR